MYVDNYLRIATAKAVTPAGNTTLTDTVDLQAARDVGQGEDIFFVFTVTQAFSATGETYFQVGYGDTAVPGIFYPHSQSCNYAAADLALGKQVTMKMSPITTQATGSSLIPPTGRRYLCARVVTTNATANVGAFTCDVVIGMQAGKQFYTSGFSFVTGA
jgi:hypothetical protein